MLAESGYSDLTKTQLNRILYDLYNDSQLNWEPGVGNERLWHIGGLPTLPLPALPDLASLPLSIKAFRWQDRSEDLSLYPWQQEALHWWREHKYQGVVEAVTGAGKTRLALAAAEEQLRRGKPVVVLVPTKDLLFQWEREFRRWLVEAMDMEISIGFLGGGRGGKDGECDVLLATIQSAYQYYLIPQSSDGLLIADEVHHYGAPKWSAALEPKFDRRLGLTATYEREDSGLEESLNPYFAGNIFSVDYRRALREDIIAPFKIAFIAVRFSADERERYEESDEKVRRYRRKLAWEYGLPEEPFGDFMREVALLRSSDEDGGRLAGFYLSAFWKRREVLANARAKFSRNAELAPAVRAADKAILFAQTQNAASNAVDGLREQGINGAVLTSSMDMSERRQVFAAFENGEHELVAAPRLLDEGVDVPAADLAIVLASSRSRRQMVQRMGRVVRKKQDRRLARLAVLFVEDTAEDPESAHEDFLYLVTGVAHDLRYFDADTSSAEICEYLNNWRA